MKAILLAGIPGTGKTTIAKKFIEMTGGFAAYESIEPVQLVNCIYNRDLDLTIVGKYDNSDEVFQGTDRLSMAVSPNFQQWVSEKKPQKMFIEGDRLVGNKTIDFLMEQGYQIEVLIIEASETIRKERYAQRGSDQSEQFIKSKATKVNNISTRMDLLMEDMLAVVKNEKPEDIEQITNSIKFFLDI